MGTSLSGLTPATTFDGLLKTGDNDPIGATLKTISDGSGTDTMLELSTTALQIGGATGMYWDNTNKRLGINNTSPNGVLEVDGVAYLNGLTYINNQDYVFGNSSFSTSNTIKAQGSMIVGDGANPTSTLQVVGSGTTSATTSLLVQNSAGTNAFEVKDNQAAYAYGGLYSSITRVNYINTYNNAYSVMQTHQGDGNASFLQSLAVGQTTTPTARLHVKGSGNDNTTTSLLVENSAGADVLQTLDNGSVGVGCPASSSYRVLMSSGVLRLKDLLFGQTGSTAINNTSLLTMKWNGSTGIGISGGGAIDATARLHIKGSGNDATTTSLLVQNSDAADILKVTDDRNIETYDATGNVIAYNNAGNRRFQINPDRTSVVDFQVSGGDLSDLIRTDSGLNSVGIGTTGLANTRLFVKGEAPSGTPLNNPTALLVQNSAGTDLLKVTDDGHISASGNRLTIGDGTDVTLRILASGNASAGNNYIQPLGTPANQRVVVTGNSVATIKAVDLDASNVYIGYGINQTAATGTLSIKGSGTTSATTSLLVQNSAGTDLFKVTDDGNVQVAEYIYPADGTTNSSIRLSQNLGTRIYYSTGYLTLNPNLAYVSSIYGTVFSVGNTTGDFSLNGATGAKMAIKGNGNDATTTALLVQNSDGTELFKVDDSGATDITANITNAVLGSFRNTDANGFGIELRAGNAASRYSMQWERYSGGGGGRLYPDGVMIGDQVAPTARLQVKGSGTTTATTALLVENSAGTDLFKIDDGRGIYLNGASTGININAAGLQLKAYNTTVLLVDGPRNQANTPSGIPFGVGTASINDASAVLQADSTTQGFLPPRMTDTEVNNISTPAEGLMVYNTTNRQMNYWNGSAWIAF